MEDRPAAISRKNRPVPAPDESIDPVDAVLDREAPAPEPTRGRKRQEIVFPFSTRLSQEAYDIIYRAVDEHGLTVREATEQAILGHWKR